MTDKNDMPDVIWLYGEPNKGFGGKSGVWNEYPIEGMKAHSKPYIRQSSISVPDGLEEALDIVKKHQEWKRGADMPMQDVKELGIAIDTVLHAARELLRVAGER